jgi:serine/threonine-protein kinase
VEAGKKLGGRYKIVRHIGSGGMANVYLGHDLILDRPVAIKVLRFDFRNNTDALRRFQREALSATQLIHPNIVGVYDVDEEDELQYIVMEFIDGTDLKKYIDIQGRVLPEKAIHICTKFCRLWRWHIKIGLFTGTSSHKIF